MNKDSLKFFPRVFDCDSVYKLHGERMQSKRLAQVSIQFVGGFFLFVIILAYVAFSAINSAFSYQNDVAENVLREEAWVFSNYIVDNVSTGTTITKAQIDAGFGSCQELDTTTHNAIKNLFNMPQDRYFHSTITAIPVALTFEPVGANFQGNATIEGTSCAFNVSKSVSSGDFDRTAISCSLPSVGIDEGDSITIAGRPYVVAKIDSAGQFVVLERTLARCGLQIPAEGRTVASVERFMPYDGHMAKIRVDYW